MQVVKPCEHMETIELYTLKGLFFVCESYLNS